MTRLLVLFVITLTCFLIAPAHAHKPSDSYLRISTGQNNLSVRWDISLKDLDMVVGIDEDANGLITWGELKARQFAIFEHAISKLSMSADDKSVPLQPGRILFVSHSDGGYAVLEFIPQPAANLKTLSITYQLLFDVDPTHRGLVLLSTTDAQGKPLGSTTHVLSPEQPKVDIDLGNISSWQSFLTYIKEGVWHIWIGYDHVLFLITLILPSVLCWKNGRWTPVEKFWPAAWDIAKIISCFTLAHTLTLWLAVMDYVVLPSKFVESVIALSIIITALHNLRPFLPGSIAGWVFGLGFGFFHGFGFAGVMKDLGAENFTLASALLGFNLGVELGQLCIVVLTLPVLYLIRRTKTYMRLFMQVGSVAAAILAAIWLAERALGISLLAW